MKNHVYVIKNRTTGAGIGTLASLVGIATDFDTAMKAVGQYLVGIPDGGTVKIWTKEKKGGSISSGIGENGTVVYGVTVLYGTLTDLYWVEEVETLK